MSKPVVGKEAAQPARAKKAEGEAGPRGEPRLEPAPAQIEATTT